MSFFGNLEKIVEVKILEKTYEFKAFQLKDFERVGNIQTLAFSNNGTDSVKAIKEMAEVLLAQYHPNANDTTTPTIDDFMQFSIELARDVFQQLVTSSQPVAYVGDNKSK
jgi:hypothetical protein